MPPARPRRQRRSHSILQKPRLASCIGGCCFHEGILFVMRFGILTLSDRSARGEREDASGPALALQIRAENGSVIRQQILPDDESTVRATL
ncbi:MAG TPA: hypothetical protein DCY14_09610, partial [Anaerolineae bacterium]|nr:hypothetical protein [Anaerolineae bacterium]